MPDPQLTEADREALRDAQRDVKTAVADRKAAIARRKALLCMYRERGVGVTELARAVPLHRSQVNRIVTKPPATEQD